jgi:hypothetical protein
MKVQKAGKAEEPMQWCKEMVSGPGLGNDRPVFLFLPVEDVVLHSESSSLSESGASHDNGEDPYPQNWPQLPPVFP